jgi:predicted SAM-dependent methyltransferase
VDRLIDRGFFYVFQHYSLGYIFRRAFLRLWRRDADAKSVGVDLECLYAHTNFEPWRYSRGESLPYPDQMFNYIFSEHFFEHLFLDEAVDLLRECRRVVAEGGVVRICVPDADLRTYARPEPVGFPDRRMPFSHPSKHKTRWNVYALCEALRVAGLKPIPLTYCDRDGRYFDHNPIDMQSEYAGCVDREMIFGMSHVYRRRSLIVDGVVPVNI